jgi:hypothetical protein
MYRKTPFRIHVRVNMYAKVRFFIHVATDIVIAHVDATHCSCQRTTIVLF